MGMPKCGGVFPRGGQGLRFLPPGGFDFGQVLTAHTGVKSKERRALRKHLVQLITIL